MISKPTMTKTKKINPRYSESELDAFYEYEYQNFFEKFKNPYKVSF